MREARFLKMQNYYLQRIDRNDCKDFVIVAILNADWSNL